MNLPYSHSSHSEMAGSAIITLFTLLFLINGVFDHCPLVAVRWIA